MLTNDPNRIVVGVDGSAHSRRALRWALDEAKRRNVSVQLVHAWEYGLAAASPYVSEALEDIADSEKELFDEEMEIARASGVPAHGDLVFGSGTKALLEASRDAALLVVGSRGRGALRSALLGSVSSACVHHAACPVVVVPDPDRAGRGSHARHAPAA